MPLLICPLSAPLMDGRTAARHPLVIQKVQLFSTTTMQSRSHPLNASNAHSNDLRQGEIQTELHCTASKPNQSVSTIFRLIHLLGGGVGGCQRHDAGTSHALEQGRLCVGQVGEIVDAGHSGAAYDTVQFGFDIGHNVRVAQHKHVHPEERRLDRLHAG